MIVFTTLINGIKDWAILTDSQRGGLLIMIFATIFFSCCSIYALIKSLNDYKLFRRIFPQSIMILVIGFTILNIISEKIPTLNVFLELLGLLLLLFPHLIYTIEKLRGEK